MKKKGYYEYDPVIYPRLLCGAIGMSQEDANKCFEGRNGEVLKVDFSNYDAITYDIVREKENKRLCSFINFASKDCFFFKDGVCNDPNEIRFTSEENPSCTGFEYKTIVEQK